MELRQSFQNLCLETRKPQLHDLAATDYAER
jgi:hypothetical protein